MKHEQITAWAEEEGLSVQQTTQGLSLVDMFPVTLVSGACDDPVALARTWFESPDREHVPAPGHKVEAFVDDRAIVITVESDGVTAPWLHVMLYDSIGNFERGWETQTAPPQVL